MTAITFQTRVQPWLMACFGAEIAADRAERNHRFLEESLELVQSCGCTASEAHQLVDYVFGRPVGEPAQEAGGVMVTLAALCLANSLDMHQAGETELARIWTKVEAIRAKQAAKPKHSPLPAAPAAVAPQGVVAWMHPETLNVISAAHKHDMSTEYGAETRRKAESHSVALVRAEQHAQAAPALEAPAAQDLPADEFRGDTPSLVRNILALLELDADGALVPHGVGGHARGLLSAAAARLAAAPQAPAQEAPAAPGVPAGFALVPIEPTQQMLDAGRWSGAGSVSIQEEWARKEVWSRMLATITPPPAAYADDLVALVENLAQALSAAAPGNDLAGHALDYLKRNGLQGSPLQAAGAAPQAPAAPVDEQSARDSACAWSVWWTHNKAKFTTPRQAALAAWNHANERALRAMAAPAAPAVDARAEFPAMTDELASILGMMCFQCISFAQALRAGGHNIKNRAEDEQAAVLHWMLGHYFRAGPEGWRAEAAADMERMRDAAAQAAAKGAA